MRHTTIFTALLAALLALAAPAWAGTEEDCVQDRDPNLRIAGCTEEIGSGAWLGEDLATIYYYRGFAYSNLGEYRRAIEDMGQALELDPDNASYFLLRGLAYHSLGKHRRAIKDFGRSLRFDPSSVIAYNSRGNAYRNLDNPGQAIKDFTRALQLDPQSAPAYNNRAWTQYYWRKYAKAMRDVNRALELAPGNPASLDTRAHILTALGRRQEALAEFEGAMEAGGKGLVRAYQQALTKRKYYRGVIDGVYGPEVRAALEACLAKKCRLME